MTPIIYLIDDDPVFNILTERVIVKHLGDGVEIEKFTNPEEALESMLNSTSLPEYIFLDILMPNLDGWELLEILNEEVSNLSDKTTVVMLTTSILPTDNKKADADLAVKYFINKPLDVVNVQLVFDQV